jgi:hypothetical protein
LKFKIDENLPVEIADLLRAKNFQADTVNEENLSGENDIGFLVTAYITDKIKEGISLQPISLRENTKKLKRIIIFIHRPIQFIIFIGGKNRLLFELSDNLNYYPPRF